VTCEQVAAGSSLLNHTEPTSTSTEEFAFNI